MSFEFYPGVLAVVVTSQGERFNIKDEKILEDTIAAILALKVQGRILQPPVQVVPVTIGPFTVKSEELPPEKAPEKPKTSGSVSERLQRAARELQAKEKGGKLPHGALSEAAMEYGVLPSSLHYTYHKMGKAAPAAEPFRLNDLAMKPCWLCHHYTRKDPEKGDCDASGQVAQVSANGHCGEWVRNWRIMTKEGAAPEEAST